MLSQRVFLLLNSCKCPFNPRKSDTHNTNAIVEVVLVPACNFFKLSFINIFTFLAIVHSWAASVCFVHVVKCEPEYDGLY